MKHNHSRTLRQSERRFGGSNAYMVLENAEAQTPRWGRPNSMVFSSTLRVTGVVCSAWLGCLSFIEPPRSSSALGPLWADGLSSVESMSSSYPPSLRDTSDTQALQLPSRT